MMSSSYSYSFSIYLFDNRRSFISPLIRHLFNDDRWSVFYGPRPPDRYEENLRHAVDSYGDTHMGGWDGQLILLALLSWLFYCFKYNYLVSFIIL